MPPPTNDIGWSERVASVAAFISLGAIPAAITLLAFDVVDAVEAVLVAAAGVAGLLLTAVAVAFGEVVSDVRQGKQES